MIYATWFCLDCQHTRFCVPTMGVGESKHPSYEAVVSLFSQAEHEEIRRIYSEICKGNVRRGFQSQDLKVEICVLIQKYEIQDNEFVFSPSNLLSEIPHGCDC